MNAVPQFPSKLGCLKITRKVREIAIWKQVSDRLSGPQDAMKTQKKVLSRADAERRLIAQEARLKESERQIKARGMMNGPKMGVG